MVTTPRSKIEDPDSRACYKTFHYIIDSVLKATFHLMYIMLMNTFQICYIHMTLRINQDTQLWFTNE